MREIQDTISSRLESDLKFVARRGEVTQYIIVAVCIGLVLLTSASVVPFFNTVIKDKSYVLALFADISVQEIQTIIGEIKALDIKTLRFKRKWILKFQGLQDAFWKKLLGEYQHGFGLPPHSHSHLSPDDDKSGLQVPSVPANEIVFSSAVQPHVTMKIEPVLINGATNEIADEHNQVDHKDLMPEAQAAYEKRRACLSTIEYFIFASE